MNLNDIPNVVTAGQLDEVSVSGLAEDSPYDLKIVINGNTVLTESFVAVGGRYDLYGLADIILTHCTNLPASQISLYFYEAGDTSPDKSKSFLAIPALMVPENQSDLWESFLIPSPVSVVPPGEPVSLSALEPEYVGQPINENISLQSTAPSAPQTKKAPVMTFSFRAPAVEGAYIYQLGTRRHILVVGRIGAGCHALRFRNVMNATEYLYLRAKVTEINTRSASIAVSGNKPQEYDLRVVRTFEFEAKNIPSHLMPSVRQLPFASDIHIDGRPVTVQELKTDVSPDDDSFRDIKFTARLAEASQIALQPAERIFTDPYNQSFQ